MSAVNGSASVAPRELARALRTEADRLRDRALLIETEPDDGERERYQDEAAASVGRLTTIVGQANGNAPTASDRYDDRVLDVGAMLAEPDEPIPWRCEGIAANGYLTTIAGRGGEGKSWLGLTLGCGVARGTSVAGIHCARGRAVIFDAENGRKLIARRFRAADVTAELAVQPVEAGGLQISKDIDWFRSVILDQAADLAVFDSLRVLSTGAKENDADEMEPIVTALKQLARETDTAIVLIHHRGRSELSEFRGSSVILDQTDLLFTFGRVPHDPEARTRRKLTTIKCRIDSEPDPRWVAIEADPKHGLVNVNAAEPFEDEGRVRPRDALREDVLAALGATSQSQAAIARKLGRDPKDQTIRRLLRDLEGEGLAERRSDGWGVSATAPGSETPDTPAPNRLAEPDWGVSGAAALTPGTEGEGR